MLGATTPGGAGAAAGGLGTLSFFARLPAMGDEEAQWAAVPYMYGERTRRRHAARIGEDIARRLGTTSSLATHVQQLGAAGAHSTAGRLREIAAPTLVVHGADDIVVPAADARRLAEEIPGARLRLWRGAGHFYVTDEPRADRDVARFLVAHSAEHGRLRRLLARARRQM